MITLTGDGDTLQPLELAAVIHWEAFPKVGNEAGPERHVVVHDDAIVDVNKYPEDELVLRIGEETRVDGRTNETPRDQESGEA